MPRRCSPREVVAMWSTVRAVGVRVSSSPLESRRRKRFEVKPRVLREGSDLLIKGADLYPLPLVLFRACRIESVEPDLRSRWHKSEIAGSCSLLSSRALQEPALVGDFNLLPRCRR